MRASQTLLTVPWAPERHLAWELADVSPLSPQRVRESVDSGLAPISPLGSGLVRRRFSGTPLLPPLSSRLGTPGEGEPSARVVFTIEARGTEQSHSPGPSR